MFPIPSLTQKPPSGCRRLPSLGSLPVGGFHVEARSVFWYLCGMTRDKEDDLSENQIIALAFLREQTKVGKSVSGRDVALRLYPDSPAWGRRTRARRTGTQSGQVGGTMPMLGAKVLHALEARGLAYQYRDGAWKSF